MDRNRLIRHITLNAEGVNMKASPGYEVRKAISESLDNEEVSRSAQMLMMENSGTRQDSYQLIRNNLKEVRDRFAKLREDIQNGGTNFGLSSMLGGGGPIGMGSPMGQNPFDDADPYGDAGDFSEGEREQLVEFLNVYAELATLVGAAEQYSDLYSAVMN